MVKSLYISRHFVKDQGQGSKVDKATKILTLDKASQGTRQNRETRHSQHSTKMQTTKNKHTEN